MDERRKRERRVQRWLLVASPAATGSVLSYWVSHIRRFGCQVIDVITVPRQPAGRPWCPLQIGEGRSEKMKKRDGDDDTPVDGQREGKTHTVYPVTH